MATESAWEVELVEDYAAQRVRIAELFADADRWKALALELYHQAMTPRRGRDRHLLRSARRELEAAGLLEPDHVKTCAERRQGRDAALRRRGTGASP